MICLRLLSAAFAAPLLLAAAGLHGAEIQVPGYPPLDDPFELGQRSALIVFLREHGVAIEAGADDARLLLLYQRHWDSRKPAPVQPAPASAAKAATPDPADSERACLELQLRREYRYSNTAGKSVAELRQVLADLQRRDVRGSAAAPPPPTVDQPVAAVEPAGNPAETARPPAPAAAQPAAATTDTRVRPRRPVNVRNHDLPSVPTLRASIRKGDLSASLLLARRMIYGLQIRYDWSGWYAIREPLVNTVDGMEFMRDQADNGDEVAAFILAETLAERSQTCPADPEAAERYLAIAAERGVPCAIERYSGPKSETSPDGAAEGYKRRRILAAEAGCTHAITSLNNDPGLTNADRLHWQRVRAYYLALSGDPEDPETIIRMAREDGETTNDVCHEQLMYLSAIRGSADAQFNLGMHYKRPDPTAEQDLRTRFWLGAAALRGHRNAMIILATVLSKTVHNPPDPVVAYTWVVRAAGGTKPYGPEWERLEARVSPEGLDAAFADARTWVPIPADTPLKVPEACVVALPSKLAAWPEHP